MYREHNKSFRIPHFMQAVLEGKPCISTEPNYTFITARRARRACTTKRLLRNNKGHPIYQGNCEAIQIVSEITSPAFFFGVLGASAAAERAPLKYEITNVVQINDHGTGVRWEQLDGLLFPIFFRIAMGRFLTFAEYYNPVNLFSDKIVIYSLLLKSFHFSFCCERIAYEMAFVERCTFTSN